MLLTEGTILSVYNRETSWILIRRNCKGTLQLLFRIFLCYLSCKV